MADKDPWDVLAGLRAKRQNEINVFKLGADYPPIPRFPEWEKAIADGIVW
jgi:hypothetical protein